MSALQVNILLTDYSLSGPEGRSYEVSLMVQDRRYRKFFDAETESSQAWTFYEHLKSLQESI